MPDKESVLRKIVFVLGSLAGLALFYFVSRKNYLLFHITVELFAIIISSSIFVLIWNSRSRDSDSPYSFIGVAYLFVGLIDFFHTLSYQGMPIFPSDIFYANQLWICARSLESVSLLIFVLSIGRTFKAKIGLVFAVYSIIAASLLLSVFYFKVFPICFVKGVGQTPFKIASEYVICAILAASTAILIRRRESANQKTRKWMLASLVSTIASELCFTQYSDNFGVMNVMGHLLKIVSFYFIFRSIILVSLEEPFTTIYSGLQEKMAELSRANAALASSEKKYIRLYEQLDSILDHIPGLVFYKDDKNNFIRVNEVMAKSYGLGKRELENKNLRELHGEAVAEGYFRDDLAVIASGEARVGIEEPWETPAGLRWVSTSKIPFKDEKGDIIGVIGISMDITERRKADEEIRSLLRDKEILLKEVHHRVKNNIATIIGLLSMQANSTDEPTAAAAIEDAERRLLSMEMLYDKLYRSASYDRISAREYLPSLIRQIMDNFPEAESVELEIDIDDFHLEIGRMSNLGIIINEVITNSMKYALAGNESPRVSIRAIAGDGKVELSMADNGGGIPEGVDFSNSSGFGLLLLREITKQLGGALAIDRKGGTRITLTFGI
jgi:PAS domain S-box-containing protein